MSYTFFLFLLTLVHSTFSSLAPMDRIHQRLFNRHAWFSLLFKLGLHNLRPLFLFLRPNLLFSRPCHRLISPVLSPLSLSNLTHLTQLILYPGLVNGPLPPRLDSLPLLRVISLTRNRLTGPIPISFPSLSNLHTLDLSYNQLSGSLPPFLTTLPRLKVLVLASNHFSNNLNPVSSPFFHLDIKMNQISGELPPAFPITLRYLSLSANSMQGTINALEPLIEQTEIDLSMNQLTGTNPNSLFSPTISAIFLQRNNFTSMATSTAMSLLPQGSIVDLSHNSISGAEALFLNNNRLTGDIPEEHVKSLINGTTEQLFLQHNYFTGFPWNSGLQLPDSVSLCLSYNCMEMEPVGGLSTCPIKVATLLSRPASQCSRFYNHSSTGERSVFLLFYSKKFAKSEEF